MLSSGHGEPLHSLAHGNYGYLHTLKSTRLVNAPAGNINWTKGHTYAKGGDRRWDGGGDVKVHAGEVGVGGGSWGGGGWINADMYEIAKE